MSKGDNTEVPEKTEEEDSTGTTTHTNEKTEPAIGNPVISRVSFKAPPFWRQNPKLYFAQIESQFFVAGITADATKFHHVVSAIETDVIATVSDIILNPPESKKYDELKARLIEQFQDSESQRIKKLLQEIQLGDDRPSQLLRKMRDLSPVIDNNLLRNLWLQRLPTAVQQILAVSTEDLDALAKMADKVMEVTDTASVHMINKPRFSCGNCSQLSKQVEELAQSLEQLKVRNAGDWRQRGYWNKRSNSKSRQRSLSRPRFDHNSGICFYHQRFGKDARECNKPCKFQQEN